MSIKRHIIDHLLLPVKAALAWSDITDKPESFTPTGGVMISCA